MVFVEVSDLDYSIFQKSGFTMRWNQGGDAAFTVRATSLTLVQSSYHKLKNIYKDC